LASYSLEPFATDENFDEEDYLRANADVAEAVRKGQVSSGRTHFDACGRKEGRRLLARTDAVPAVIAEAKRRKLQRIRPLLRSDMPCVETPVFHDFLSAELRAQFDIVDTDAVSSNGYDGHAVGFI